MTARRFRDTLWRKRLNALQRAWTAAREGDPAGVHQLRVASRRIREALPVVSDGNHPRRLKRARRKVRALTQTLGPVRDHDVSLKLLSVLEERHPETRLALGLVRQSIAAERRELRLELEKYLGGTTPEELVKKLTRATRRSKQSGNDHHESAKNGRPDERQWRVMLPARIARRTKQLHEAVEHAGALYAPDRLHVVRVAVKKLRYALEVGQEVQVARWGSAIRSLKNMQDILGELQDREALLEAVRVAHAFHSSHDISEGFGRLTRLLEEETRRYHAQFVRRRGRLLKLCAGVRQQVSHTLPIGRPAPRGLVDVVSRSAAGPDSASAGGSRR